MTKEMKRPISNITQDSIKPLLSKDEYINYLESKLSNAKPQLTIHKSIADKLDDIFNEFVREQDSRNIWTFLYRAEEQNYEIGYELEALLPDETQVNIAIAYLTGKALRVDLVKVVEE